MPIMLITGCSSGIGRALADAFKAAGYEVWATARKSADVAQLKAAGFVAVQLDVNNSMEVDQLAARFKQHGQGLDVLINNAGYGAMGPLLDGALQHLQLGGRRGQVAGVDVPLGHKAFRQVRVVEHRQAFRACAAATSA